MDNAQVRVRWDVAQLPLSFLPSTRASVLTGTVIPPENTSCVTQEQTRMACPPCMTCMGKEECDNQTKLERQVSRPSALPPSTSPEGRPTQKVKDEGV